MKRLSISLVLAVILVISSVGTALAALPSPQGPTAQTASSITKSVEPTGVVDAGDTLTYTIVVDPEASTINLPMYFVDPISAGLTDVQFIEKPATIMWSEMYHAVAGTLNPSTTDPITISFTAKVNPSETFMLGSDIDNQAALCRSDPEGTITLVICPEVSNKVTNSTFTYIFLPLVMRNFTP